MTSASKHLRAVERPEGAQPALLIREGDANLVDAARNGASAALSELVRRHSAKAFRAALRVTRNQQDAEDALQTALMTAFTHIDTFEGRAQFSTWLTRITINASLMILRARRRYCDMETLSSDGAPLCDVSQIIDPSMDAESALVQEQRSNELRRAVARLRPELRRVVEVQQANDLSIKETAELSNLSVAATKARMLRARRSLRKLLRR